MKTKPILSTTGKGEPTSKRMKLDYSDSEDGKPAKSPSTEVPCWNNMCTDIWMRNVLPFIGRNQYRFVGAVNRHFRTTYLAAFSSTTTTYKEITSMEQAILCYSDLNESPVQLETLWKVLAAQGHKDILRFYYNNPMAPSAALTAAAAKGGHFDLLRWLVRQNCPVDKTTLAAAAIHGDLAMFQWLVALPASQPRPWYESPWDIHAVYNAALYGHLELLEWISAKDSIQLDDLCSMAARNGHLHVLQFALSQDCPRDESTCANAAMNGHLETLQWLRANDCP
jgi:hypothetical protein